MYRRGPPNWSRFHFTMVHLRLENEKDVMTSHSLARKKVGHVTGQWSVCSQLRNWRHKTSFSDVWREACIGSVANCPLGKVLNNKN